MSKKSRERNLAILGGLGAAALMMGRRKKGEDKEKTVSVPAGPQTYADMPRGEKVLSEAGEDSGFRRNPETGDLYRDVLGDMRTRAQESADDEKIFRATGVRPRPAMKKGGSVKKYAGGGSVSKRADGCAVKGKTRGRVI